MRDVTELIARTSVVKSLVVKEYFVETWTCSFVTSQLMAPYYFSADLDRPGGGFRWVGDCGGVTVPMLAKVKF